MMCSYCWRLKQEQNITNGTLEVFPQKLTEKDQGEKNKITSENLMHSSDHVKGYQDWKELGIPGTPLWEHLVPSSEGNTAQEGSVTKVLSSFLYNKFMLLEWTAPGNGCRGIG